MKRFANGMFSLLQLIPLRKKLKTGVVLPEAEAIVFSKHVRVGGAHHTKSARRGEVAGANINDDHNDVVVGEGCMGTGRQQAEQART